MTVISKEVIYETFMPPLYIVGIVSLLVVAISGILWIRHIKYTEAYGDKFSNNVVKIWFSTLAVFMVLTVSFSSLWKVPTDRYKYEMTFTDVNAMNEAFNTYEYVGYDNGVYTFEDRE